MLIQTKFKKRSPKNFKNREKIVGNLTNIIDLFASHVHFFFFANF